MVQNYNNLKKTVIEKYPEEELSDSFSLCDSIITHLVEGDLDLEFFFTHENMKEDDKKAIALTKKYQKLCFYDGDFNNWSDSVEGPFQLSDEVTTTRILDNYQFLLGLSKTGGEAVLEQIEKFQEHEGYADSSVIDYLRSTFGNDSLLVATLTHMSNPDAMYQLFTDDQKAELLKFPEGTLYYYGEGGIRFTHPLVLSTEIYQRMEGQQVDLTAVDSVSSVAAELTEYFHSDVDFSSVVMDMSTDYQRAVHKMIGVPTTDMIHAIKDMQGEIPKTSWLVDDSSLGEMFETPFQPTTDSSRKK